METVKVKIEKWQCLLVAAWAEIWFAPIIFGQLKISSLDEVKNKAKEGADTMTEIAKYIIVAALAIGLVFVIYQVANNTPKAKDYALAWIIAVVLCLIGYLII